MFNNVVIDKDYFYSTCIFPLLKLCITYLMEVKERLCLEESKQAHFWFVG